MRNGPFALVLAAAVLVTACRPAASPAPVPAPVDAAGRWAIVLEAQGQPIDVILELTRVSAGEYAGSASSQAFPTMQLQKATLVGNRLTIHSPSPTGDVAVFNLIIDGDTMTGDWAMPGMGSRVTGRRIP